MRQQWCCQFNKETKMSLVELCVLLGVMIAFATLVLKVVEVSRDE